MEIKIFYLLIELDVLEDAPVPLQNWSTVSLASSHGLQKSQPASKGTISC